MEKTWSRPVFISLFILFPRLPWHFFLLHSSHTQIRRIRLLIVLVLYGTSVVGLNLAYEQELGCKRVATQLGQRTNGTAKSRRKSRFCCQNGNVEVVVARKGSQCASSKWDPSKPPSVSGGFLYACMCVFKTELDGKSGEKGQYRVQRPHSRGWKWSCISSSINHLFISSFPSRCKWEVHLRTKELWDTFPALTCKLLQVLS